MSENERIKGIGGFLILVGLGLVFFPFRQGLEIIPTYYKLITDGSFTYLTTPGTEAYNELWLPLFLFEMGYNALMILVSFGLIYLFFKKHYLFPKSYIAFALVPIVLIPLDAYMVTLVAKNETTFSVETNIELIRSIITAAIWVPYMIFSKRVKATFVEGKDDSPSLGTV
ncbi:hypothetical protein LPTSP4_23730 [Leptospira ryugenii]|uniref:DUF2569 domain-containing protein n=1 Tax=Leptospira ryugenii TaxID=1917863 RepID=A0A2P2E216_9LEPT|nr:DUF2569 domain-containing protein [Leptospira ryugenii]GBF50846.1 hypothetical protein LPTSP4_23730 [Leptospira ryugenii]